MSESVNEKELQKERKEIIARILQIQKKFMDLEREKGVTEKDIHHNPKGIVKEYKEEHEKLFMLFFVFFNDCLLYTSPSPRDGLLSRMPSSA